MARPAPQLVNKQFNSPIKLYSQQNVKEVLDRETQILANGAVGIDFNNLSKPGNLANSAVLRMLEEEERQNGKSGKLKRVAWPPPPEGDYSNGISEEPAHVQGGPQINQGFHPPPVQHVHQPQLRVQTAPLPVSHPPSSVSPKGWSHVRSPVVSPHQPQFPVQPAYQPPAPQPHFQSPPSPFQPATGLLTLRKAAPISQAPAPVYTSQPATASLQGGSNMRGDQKWPPAAVKAQSEQENEARRLLAKGPACRPRRVKKDYSSFFAQHALNSTYPGYRAPPGTQHYDEPQFPGTSNL